jgi:hypothetical protein
MKEFVSLIEKNANYNRERIRTIKTVNENQLEIYVEIAPFLPQAKATLVYNRFERGKMYFNILSSGGIKMLMGIFTEMGGTTNNEFIRFDKNNIVIEINKLLSDKFKGIHVKDMNLAGEQIYFTIDIK